MAERDKGSVINVSTMAAEIGVPGMAVYGASKAALNLLRQSWAAEYGPNGVRVNAVSPGTVRTPSVERMGEVLDQMGGQSRAGYVALYLHGFPDSVYTWRYLLPDLAAAGFRAVAPWLRGYAPISVPVD
jgi:NAD(P)-dependent dehydrogenase (short-subunit alcohol dehydrogenase family)